uniref:Pyruvate dehydrogenase E1 component subunit beta n=1 Tax=Aegilops tauschii TaxID=37682 RepID=M8BP72_AEGTA
MGAVGAESRGVGDEENGVGTGGCQQPAPYDGGQGGGRGLQVQVDVSNLPPTTSMIGILGEKVTTVGKASNYMSQIKVINLRSVRPLDRAAIKAYVTKINRLVILEEGSPQHRVGAEIWFSLSLHTHIMSGSHAVTEISSARLHFLGEPTFPSKVHSEGEDCWSRRPFI